MWTIIQTTVQPYMIKPHNLREKFLTIFWIFGVFLHAAHYKNLMKTSMIEIDKGWIIDGLEDILKYPNFIPSMVKGDPLVQEFQRGDGVKKKIWQQATRLGLQKSLVNRTTEQIHLRVKMTLRKKTVFIAPKYSTITVRRFACNLLAVEPMPDRVPWVGRKGFGQGNSGMIINKHIDPMKRKRVEEM